MDDKLKKFLILENGVIEHHVIANPVLCAIARLGFVEVNKHKIYLKEKTNFIRQSYNGF